MAGWPYTCGTCRVTRDFPSGYPTIACIEPDCTGTTHREAPSPPAAEPYIDLVTRQVVCPP